MSLDIFVIACFVAVAIVFMLPYSWVNPPPFDSKNFKKETDDADQ